VRWKKVTIIGVGLLGGSIGLALRERGLAGEVRGVVRRKISVNECRRAGAVDTAGLDVANGVEGADLVVLCTPIARMEAVVTELLPALKPGAIVTDVGSVKGPVVRRLTARVRRAGGVFIGSHPMAGSEKGGVRAARADLFDGAVCVVTPTRATPKPALQSLTRFWRGLGATVLTMDAARHDRLVSRASHLPHMVASALALHVLDPRRDGRQPLLCASGFRDTTRVAAGSAEMWRDIALANRANLVRDLAAFEKRLAGLRRAIESGDEADVSRFLAEAQRLRLQWEKRRAVTGRE